jgi:hypothetical protein
MLGRCRIVLSTALFLLSMSLSRVRTRYPPGCSGAGSALFVRTLRDTNGDGVPDTVFSGNVERRRGLGLRMPPDLRRTASVAGYHVRPSCSSTLRQAARRSWTSRAEIDPSPVLRSGVQSRGHESVLQRHERTTSRATSMRTRSCPNQTHIRGVCRYQNGTSHVDADDEFPISAELAICIQVRYCGDGVLQTADGETCDPPGSPRGHQREPVPRELHGLRRCSPGRREACDDGNGVDTDNCRNNCMLPDPAYH